MQTLTEKVWRLAPPNGLFDTTVVVNLFPQATAGSRRAFVNKALRHHEILRLSPGIYCLGREFQPAQPHPFVVAASIHGPSYVTMESALAFHGFIPEAVHGVVSGTVGRTRVFTNPLGRFEYRRICCEPFMTGVVHEKIDGTQWASVAGPARALADLAYVRKDIGSCASAVKFLTESLRIEPDDLQRIPLDQIVAVRGAFRSHRVRAVLGAIEREIRP